MAHRILLGLLALVAVGYVYQATQIAMDPWTAAETVNTRTLPVLYGSLLGGVSILLLLRAPRSAREAPDGYRLLRLAGLLLLVLAFIVALPHVPLWIALGVLLAALPLWLGERNLWRIAGLALGVPIIGWLGIEVLLGLYLPS